MTLIGQREWQDVTVSVDFRLPAVTNVTAGCVYNRGSQMWEYGMVFCVYTDKTYTLSLGGPSQVGCEGVGREKEKEKKSIRKRGRKH